MFFFPYVASLVAICVCWNFLLMKNGPVNQILNAIGFSMKKSWTSSRDLAIWAIIIVSVWRNAGYYMVMYLAGLQGVPGELYEAATIDGCSPLRVYTQIMLPNSQSPLVCLAIFNFSAVWNDYLNPLIFLNDSDKYTVALGLSLFTDMTGVLWGQLMAACLMATLPIVIMFFIAQDKFIESVALSGMKG